MKSHIMDSAMFQQWLIDKRGLADSSLYQYIQVINRFLATDPNLEDLELYNNFLIKYTRKKRSSHYYSILKAFVEFEISDASLKNKIINNLIKPPERRDIVRERKHLQEDQLMEVINYLDKHKHRVLAVIQMLTGVRAGDILRLKDGDIIPEVYENKPVLKLNILGKRKKRNVVFIHDEVGQKIVMDYITFNSGIPGYYFLEKSKFNVKGNDIHKINNLMKMNYIWFWRDLKQATNMIGLDYKDFATHDFRRCFARRVWEKYKDINVLQSLLNHTDPKVTLRYLEQSGLKNIDYHYEMQK